jgi:hypothetical protein
VEDLSSLLKPDPVSSLVPTSQHGGNQVSANNAMTAPGGASGDLGNDLNEAVVVNAPVVETAPKNPARSDSKPDPKSWSPPGPPAWGKTTSPDVVRNPEG